MPAEVRLDKRCSEFPTSAYQRQVSGISGTFSRGLEFPASI
jgi:hypothetical protein